MPTRILLVGGGGREHALAWKLSGEPGVNLVVVAPGSDAIAELPRVLRVPLPVVDGATVVDLARRHAVELAVIGPEQPLADGVADALRAAGVPTFGPSAAAARIETSKAFCHEVAAAAGVRMARARVCRSPADAMAAIRELADAGSGFVIKDDGLAAGKGVSVHDPADAAAVADEIGSLFDSRGAPQTVLVEERLAGPEASVIAIADGRDLIALPAARDHKRLLDGEVGPNTGGMGAYSPLPDLPDYLVRAILESVHRPILAELARRGTPFIGALYAGLMLTSDGPALLECNARFGDPETQVVLPRIALSLGPLLLAAARGELGPSVRRVGLEVPVTPDAAVGIVLAGRDYPAAAVRGDRIHGLADAAAQGALIFHAGTRGHEDGGFETNGGRILTVVGRGPSLADARTAAERAADAVSFQGAQRRHDIAAGGVPVGAAS
ncbi:MAG TPA: phosphoribosylamine--glycine ligase [Candidatus Limnocylindrales bacterium]